MLNFKMFTNHKLRTGLLLPTVHHSMGAMWQNLYLLPDKNSHYKIVRNDFYAPVFFFFPSSSRLV
ncbi:hypothetical protein ACJIZ3_009230 [Penstemon smallii]|uniref:Uncharacterized protein n=1 Tax=Penstemon smallii TaxID=265156 RepID=A0ABD3TBZ9_9LAMI